MNQATDHPAWMDDELVKDIPAKKLFFLAEIFRDGHGKNQKEMFVFLMNMMKKANQEKLTFTSAEMNSAITAIKKYSTKEDLSKINELLDKVQKKTSGGE